MKINRKNIKIIYSTSIFFILLPLIAGAAGLVPCGGPDNPCEICDLLELVQKVLDFALKMAFLIVIGFIVYGGLRWILSLGKEANLKAGQQIITNAIIGLVIILTAWIMINTIFWFIAQAGGDNYMGTWFHVECSDSSSILNTPENNTPSNGEDEGIIPDNEEDEDIIPDNEEDEDIIPDNEEDEIDDEEEEWKDVAQYIISDPSQMCLPIAISRECADGFNLNKSKCKPGEHTITKEDYITSNGKGRYCEFEGNINPIGSEVNPCYPPNGTLYIDCVIDPNYIPPEEQIEAKKNEIEEKYPDLDGEWKEGLAMCQEWEQNCTEVQATADCGTQSTIKDGFCLATEPTKLLNSPGENYGNGWFCEFGKSDINSPSPEGKSFAYCVPKETGVLTNPIDSELEPETGTYKACRVSNWAPLSGNQTLYCKEVDWTGEKPEDECSIIDEVCPVESGAF